MRTSQTPMAGLLMVFTFQMLVVPDAGEKRGNENDASAYENSNVKFSHAFPPIPSNFWSEAF